MAEAYPVTGRSGRVIAVCSTEQNANMVAIKIVRAGGEAQACDAVPFNPATAKDPEMLEQLVKASLA